MEQESQKYNSQTKTNYVKLAKIAAKQRIPLLAAQYPYRPLKPLQNMLAETTGVIFVDNQQVFSDAIAQYGYDAIFWDRFAGDFGHCTKKGNRILANQIATKILNILGE